MNKKHELKPGQFYTIGNVCVLRKEDGDYQFTVEEEINGEVIERDATLEEIKNVGWHVAEMD